MTKKLCPDRRELRLRPLGRCVPSELPSLAVSSSSISRFLENSCRPGSSAEYLADVFGLVNSRLFGDLSDLVRGVALARGDGAKAASSDSRINSSSSSLSTAAPAPSSSVPIPGASASSGSASAAAASAAASASSAASVAGASASERAQAKLAPVRA